VDSDAEVKERKGPYRPIVSEDERAEVVAYNEDVDYVIIKEEKEFNWNLAQAIKTDFIILSESTFVTYEGGRDQMSKTLRNGLRRYPSAPAAETSTTGKIHRLLTETLVNAKEKILSIFDELLGGK
jgi:glycerol-3-phosphate cytidylyltransferase-like family protein